jgi:small subunit ribosomal protein S6
MVIVDPDVTEQERTELFDRFGELIAGQSGYLVENDEWGTRKLAYPIKKKPRGFYLRIDYCGSGNLVTELERNLRIEDRILKYMTVLLEENPDIEALKEAAARKEAEETAAAQEEAERKEAESAAKASAPEAAEPPLPEAPEAPLPEAAKPSAPGESEPEAPAEASSPEPAAESSESVAEPEADSDTAEEKPASTSESEVKEGA